MDTDTALNQCTSDIVSAYVRHHNVAAEQVPDLIKTVYASLQRLGEPANLAVAAVPLTPAVSIKRSVQPDAIICLECGFKAKTIKRHIAAQHGMTTEQYKARWGLPVTYPMVAPAYSARRSAMAKEIGLGRKAAVPLPAPAADEQSRRPIRRGSKGKAGGASATA